MRCKSRRQLIGTIGGFLTALLLGPNTLAGDPKVHKYRHSDIDMPVSLGVGTVRTPEFAVKPEAYFIMIQAERRLPFHEMACMMALSLGQYQKGGCNTEPILQATWIVWDEGHIVSQGTSSREGGEIYTDKHMFKILGKFMGEPEKGYVVEVKFTKDGTPLNICNPHLIVIRVRKH